jgi:hypothetical protein
MSLKAPGKSLEVGNRHVISHLPIVEIVASLREHILGIDRLEYRSLSALVANGG